MSASAPSGDGGKPRILVIDDDPEIRGMLVMRLGSHGFEVLEAGDGEEGLEKVEELAPNLIVLDVMMPGMSGWEVARALKRNQATAQVPVLMLTAIGRAVNQMTSPLYGADAYMDKPFELDELEQRIRDMLGYTDE